MEGRSQLCGKLSPEEAPTSHLLQHRLLQEKSGQLQCLAVGDQPLHSLVGGLVSLLWDEAHDAPSENVRGRKGWPPPYVCVCASTCMCRDPLHEGLEL